MEIASGFTCDDWKSLDLSNLKNSDWGKAISVFRSRITERYINPADILIDHSERRFGFTILAIDCLLIETLQAFKDGNEKTQRTKGKQVFVKFLTQSINLGKHFSNKYAVEFYDSYRNGILHQAQIKKNHLVWSVGAVVHEKNGAMVINRTKFHQLLKKDFEDYIQLLSDANNTKLRCNFKLKMDTLCKDNEWVNLPSLIREKRNGKLREIEKEKLHQEAGRIAQKEEAQRIEKVRIEKQRKLQERENAVARLKECLESDFLSVDAFFQESYADIITKQDYEAEKIAFVKSWITSNTPNKQSPDDEQAAAIALLHEHIQVVARAGSGKTTTLVNRAFFLLKHCRITPSEILILVFNKKAQLEITARLLNMLGNNADSMPHIMTFHALAHAIVRPEESILSNEADNDSGVLDREFQQVLNNRLNIPASLMKFRKLILGYFREYWERIITGRYDQNKDEFLRFRRSLKSETMGGDNVKSHGERVIANFLFEHGIQYKYEHNHWWGKINYRPDFTIFKTANSGVIIEYFGLQGDTDYDEMSKQKRAYWKNKLDYWTLIELSPVDIARDGVDSLKNQLMDQGVACTRLSEDAIWRSIQDRRAIDKFTKTLGDFVGKCRMQSLSPAELRERIKRYSPLSDVETMFHKIACRLYASYLKRLKDMDKEDFNGLMQRAAETVNTGNTRFERKSGGGDLASLRYVCIDEFQDFTNLFYRLLSAVRKHNPTVELFCVGDDWQAINGFAGSDLKFFSNFKEHIGESRKLYISTNYRSSKSIVAAGNALMKGLGKPAVAHKQTVGKVLIADINKFKPFRTLTEKQRHPRDIITPAVIRLANNAFIANKDVVLLCRKNTIPWPVGDNRTLKKFLVHIRSFFAKELQERTSISTTHKYKGLEKDMVIVLDAVEQSYPLIHPHWFFSRILGDSIEKTVEEERRLFYVVLTRAVETLVIVTDGEKKSPFLKELECVIPLPAIKWHDFPPVRTNRLVVIKVGNQERRGSTPTLGIKDILKESQYQWQTNGWKAWAKSIPIEGFTIDAIKSEIWCKSADGIEVRIFDATETNLLARYLIDNGNWRRATDSIACDIIES